MKKNYPFLLSFCIISTSGFSQNVGIGTTTPAARLHVVGSSPDLVVFSGGNSMYITLAEGSNNRGYIGSFLGNAEDVDFGTYGGNITGKIHLATNAQARLTVAANGNVGIGTVNPEQLFSVAGDMVIDQNNGNTGTVGSTLHFGSSSGELIGSRRTAGTNQYGLDFYTGGINRMTITYAGTLAIGTITPEASALVDMNSNNKGITIPRLTSAQRDAIANPGTGLLVFDLTFKTIFLFDGLSWVPLIAGTLDSLKPGVQTANDITDDDRFGSSTGIDDQWAIIGAPNANNGANINVGSAYIYQRTGNDWVQITKLIPDNITANQYFGTSVSIDYPYVVVGASGVNSFIGNIYVYFFNGSSWVQVNKFTKPSIQEFAEFGRSVDIDGNYIIAGAPEANDAATDAGAVYVYKLNAGAWSYYSTLTASGAQQFDFYGCAVSIAGENILVGASGKDSSPGDNKGVCYLYRLQGGSWTFKQIIGPFDTDDEGLEKVDTYTYQGFGSSVDLDTSNAVGSYKMMAIVGSPLTDFKPFVSAMVPGYEVLNLGAVHTFKGTTLDVLIDNKIITEIYGPPYLNPNDLHFGNSVSIAFKGIFGNGSFEADFIVGTPSSFGMKGNIAQYRITENITMLANGSPSYNNHTTLYKLKNYSDNMNNAETGYACDMFDTNKMIIGIPGKNNNKGGVIFSF
jgi:hypothetical protein